MKLDDAHTRDFLPEFALPSAFLPDALDSMMNYCDGRLDCLPAPMTLDACEALTDEELQAFFEEFGLVKYYPDISKSRRAWMLYMQQKLWRLLGTPESIEVLCRFLFDQVEINLTIKDNLAFDEEGHLIDENLYDTFDAEISPADAYLPDTMLLRILANILRFTRNQEYLRAFTFLFEIFQKTTNVSITDGAKYAVNYECYATQQPVI